MITTPKTFLKFFPTLWRLGAVGAVLFFALGLALALWGSPPDYQQKETVRIMYIHVPTAWLSLGIFALMGLLNLVGLISGVAFNFLISRALAPVGFTFSLICLGTGMIWGKPMWGAWWVWDGRLTSMAFLAILYGGYMLLTDGFDHPLQGLKRGAFLSIFGCLNLPIIKFSVTWWSTLHQGASVLRMGGPSIHSSMLTPLLFMVGAFSCLALTVGLWRIHTGLLVLRNHQKRLRALGPVEGRSHV
jgi:heme exporter protein C